MTQTRTLKHVFSLDVLDHGRILKHIIPDELNQVMWGRDTLEYFHIDSWQSQS